MIKVVLNDNAQFTTQYSILQKKIRKQINRVNGCLYGTHNVWCTDRSVDFWLSLNVIRKLRHVLYCNVRVLLWHVLFHTSHSTL